MKASGVSFLSGIIFAIGLTVSGMVNPHKVRAFLDLFGDWDPSLALVMAGAIGVNFSANRWILKRRPVYSKVYHLPQNEVLDRRLLIGAAIFGVGWGILGICPGPAIVNLLTLDSSIFLFIAAMMLGMASSKIASFLDRK